MAGIGYNHYIATKQQPEIDMATIKTTANDLANAYFGGKISGTCRAPEGMTSHGRIVRFISIAKNSHAVTLSGIVGKGAFLRKWEEKFDALSVEIDD